MDYMKYHFETTEVQPISFSKTAKDASDNSSILQVLIELFALMLALTSETLAYVMSSSSSQKLFIQKILATERIKKLPDMPQKIDFLLF